MTNESQRTSAGRLWLNTFSKTRFGYIEVLFYTFNITGIEIFVRYIEDVVI